MADDKPGGDDLFEDLDKFFAPIRDVDWESEESPAASGAPARGARRRPPPETGPDRDRGRAGRDPAHPSAIDDDDEDDDAWYDTSVLEPIDELMGEAIEDEDIGTSRRRRGRHRRRRRDRRRLGRRTRRRLGGARRGSAMSHGRR